MANRFEELKRITPNQYAQGAPVILEAGALVKDNADGRVLVQLKIRNIYNSPLIACKVNIKSFDISGESVGPDLQYSYLDIHVNYGENTGIKKPIYLNENTCRAVEVCVIEAVYENSYIWKAEPMEWTMLPGMSCIDVELKDVELIKQYHLDAGPNSSYTPKMVGTCFMCTCGEFSLGSICCKCHRRYSDIHSIADIARLTQAKNSRLEKQREAEKKEKARALENEYRVCLDVLNASSSIEQLEDARVRFLKLGAYKDSSQLAEKIQNAIDRLKQQQDLDEKENRRKKKKKKRIIICVALLLVVVCSVALVWLFYLKPLQDYNSALNDIKQKKYEDGIKLLYSIYPFKDSGNVIVDSGLQWAEELVKESKNEQAEIVMADYFATEVIEHDSGTYSLESLSNKIMNKELYSKYITASETQDKIRDIFSEIVHSRNLEKEQNSISSGDFDDLLVNTYELSGERYELSSEAAEESCKESLYTEIEGYLSDSKYDEAIASCEIFQTYFLPEHTEEEETINTLLKKVYYEYGKSEISNKQYESAFECLEKCLDYGDAQAVYNKAIYSYALNFIKAEKYSEGRTFLRKIESYQKSKDYIDYCTMMITLDSGNMSIDILKSYIKYIDNISQKKFSAALTAKEIYNKYDYVQAFKLINNKTVDIVEYDTGKDDGTLKIKDGKVMWTGVYGGEYGDAWTATLSISNKQLCLSDFSEYWTWYDKYNPTLELSNDHKYLEFVIHFDDGAGGTVSHLDKEGKLQ